MSSSRYRQFRESISDLRFKIIYYRTHIHEVNSTVIMNDLMESDDILARVRAHMLLPYTLTDEEGLDLYSSLVDYQSEMMGFLHSLEHIPSGDL